MRQLRLGDVFDYCDVSPTDAMAGWGIYLFGNKKDLNVITCNKDQGQYNFGFWSMGHILIFI